MDKFSQLTIEEIKYYVYCLVNPIDNKIFYVWKWEGNRVFQHAKWIIEKDSLSEKEEVIKKILNQNKKVEYFILRHKLTDNEAFLLESVLIDLLTYKSFYFKWWADLKNLVQWYNKSLYWLFTTEEIEAIYWSEELCLENIKHNLMIININKTYKSWISLYEATRKSWKINKNKIENIEYYICEYKWILRAIFKFDSWKYVLDEKWNRRVEFEWYEITKENDKEKVMELYLYKKFKKSKGDMQVIHYLNKN